MEGKFADYSVSVRYSILSPASPESPEGLWFVPPSVAFHGPVAGLPGRGMLFAHGLPPHGPGTLTRCFPW